MHTPRTILLVKSQKFAHQAGYFLHQGRWHSVKQDKPVPKGVPVAAHPQAAGEHKPVVLAPEQIEQLKYPAEKAAANAEMKAFNEKHLPKLLAHGAAGDATALLGAGFGVNSHAKKQAAIANFLLSEMGSAHQVAPGQAAGAHAAVQSVPAAEPVPAEAKGPVPAPVEPPAPEPAAPPAAAALTAPEFAEGKKTAGVKAYYDGKAAEIIAAPDLAALQAIKKPELGSWSGKTPNSKKLLALFDQAEAAFAAPAAAPEPVIAPVAAAPEPAPEPVAAPAPAAALDQIPWDKQLLPESNTNAKSHNAKVAKIKAMAYAGDVSGLEALKTGVNTYGKKQNLLALTAIAAIQEGAPAPVASAPEPAPVVAPAAAPEAAPPATVHMKGYEYKQDANAGLGWQFKQADTGEWHDVLNPGVIAQLNTQQGGATPEAGPKDGDTKPAASGGTLVFKNGRWHKYVDADESGELPAVLVPVDDTPPELTGVDAVAIPDFAALDPSSWGKHYTNVANELKAAVKANGAAGLKGLVINHSDGRFTIKAAGVSLKKVGPNDSSPNPATIARRAAMHKFVTELKAAAGKAPKVKKAPAAAAAPAAAGPALESIDAWAQTGPQGGSNPGGRFKDDEGVEWYCKFPANEDIAKSEVLAAKLYGAVGVSGQDAKLITKAGQVGIASRWVTVSKAGTPADLAKVQGAQSGFAVDAWLGNWDVIGAAYDNLQVGADGKAVRVDAGGSLEYRAQGSKKPFGASVDELTTMRDAKINPQAAAIFGKMTPADITASAAKVAGISDPQIRAIVEEFGPGDKAARKVLADVLIARKADIVAKYPKAGKTPKKRLDPTKLPVQAASLPQPHDFANWNGAGQGLSSKPHINAANQSVEQAALDTALGGNLVALKEFKYTGIDKDTGNAGSAPLPIAQHPSKHVVQYHADLVQALDEIANPPEALKAFRETDIGTLSALEAAYPPKPFGTTVGSVSSNEKMGFWVALGQVADTSVKKLAPKKVSDYSSAAIAAAKAKYKDAPSLAKHFIKSVQSSGSYNDLFRDGKTMDHSGNKLADVAQAALAHATQMPEGTTLYRWQKMTDQMLKHIMAAPDGTVFQATGPMCTSYSPTSTAGFGKHRVVIRYAEGAKAVESFGSGGFAGEKEVTTLPNNRYVILSKKMVPDVEHGYATGERLELEILMLPPDLGLPGVKG